MDVVVPLLIFAALGSLMLPLLTASVPDDERGWLLRALAVALALRLATATLFALVPSTRIFHDDAEGYEYIGMAFARRWHGEGPPVFLAEVSNLGHFYVCGALYYIFGAFQAVPSYFNAVLGTATVFAMYRFARRMFHIIVARRLALLLAVLPSIVLWNSLALKDTEVILLLVIALSSCLELKRKVTVTNVLGIVLPVVALQPLRFYLVYFLGLSVVLSLAVERGGKILSGVPKMIAIAAGVIALFAVVGLSARTQDDMSNFDLKRINTFRHGMAATANSGFAADADVSTPARAMAFMPVGVAVLMFGPFPWQMTSLRPLLAAPETLLWWMFVPATIRGLRFAIRHRFSESSPALLFSAMLIPAYSLIQGNVGGAFRQRAQIFVLLFLFTALGQAMQRCRQLGVDEKRLLEGNA